MTDSIESAGLQEPTPTVAPQPQEQVVPQHRVNELISDALERGKKKGYAAAQSEFQGAQQQQPQQQSQFNPQDLVKQAVSEAVLEIKKAAEADAMQRKQNEHVERVVNSLSSSIQEAKGRISDFDQVLQNSSVNFGDYPELLEAIESSGQAGDVLYELAKNPGKVGMLMGLSRSPAAMKAEAKRIADSIKANQVSANNTKLPNEPLSQFKPNNSGIDKRPTSASDWAAYYKGRY